MSNIRVTILSGIPGSGKSTWVANQIKGGNLQGFTIKPYFELFAGNSLSGSLASVGVVSADRYFMRDGEYKFDPNELSKAHGNCLLGFIHLLQCDWFDENDDDEHLIIVDNTNTTVLEIAPYMAIASAHDVPVTLHTFKCDPKVGAERNKHGVPLQGCVRMAENIERREFPPFWRFNHIVHHND